ncbi:MAG: lipid-A-disaccharide synthase [Hyphomicrobiales bacterium]|nr:lipid-A-disaccharide synthase [Hyphomicrobiales bacterium]
MSEAPRRLKICVVAGEESGDQLGFKLIQALRARAPGIDFFGVGGAAMQAQGLRSQFDIHDISVMGILPVIKRLPLLLRRIAETAAAVVAQKPDVLVIIDSPDFTHRVARKVRAAAPSIPIVDYVSPTVWAWRPGRARKMRAYVDHLLALLPFEPKAHADLGGPPTTYVGHPLMERLAEYRPDAASARDAQPPMLLILPGSRRSEITRLMPVFGAALQIVAARVGEVRAVLPAVDRLAQEIETAVRDWPVKPEILRGEAAKLAAFRSAYAALAASGTVTLELALAGVPMVAAYKMNALEFGIAVRVVRLASVLLPNIILDRLVVPEFLQDACTAEALADALTPLLTASAPRATQVAALAEIDALMRLPEGETASDRAAEIVLRYAQGA